MTPPQVSDNLKKIQSLAGTWDGATATNGENQHITVEYLVTSGGSAVLERLSPGTPYEMVSVYHDENGKLAMTHYCMLGNHPNMGLRTATDQKMSFVFSKTPSINSAKDTFMQSLDITWSDNDHIQHDWVLYEAGKKKGTTTFNLVRKK